MNATQNAVYCALVHYPVKNREGETITTAVTNLDVHDIARSAKTYGLKGYFIVTPIEAQRVLVKQIVDHWTLGAGKKRIPERGNALEVIEIVDSLAHAITRITEREGVAPEVVVTAARSAGHKRQFSFSEQREHFASLNKPTLLVFGTGHGLCDALIADADTLLEPIDSGSGYNHLSVRAAAAIVFDRLLGKT